MTATEIRQLAYMNAALVLGGFFDDRVRFQ